MQHGDLVSNGPALKRFAGKTLSQPFKTFAAPLHNVSKFPLTQRKSKKCLSPSLSFSPSLLLYSTHFWTGDLQLCQIKWNKQGPTVKWKKGTFDFCKMSVGGSNRVCLLKAPGHWWFVRGDHETPHLSESIYCPLLLAANHHQGLSSLPVYCDKHMVNLIF